MPRGLAVLAGLAFPGFAESADAQWEARVLDLPAPVTAVRQAGDAVFVEAGGWRRLTPCEGGLCVDRAEPPALSVAPDGIPHGTVATAVTGDITRAWLSEPTGRYGHGVLGDSTEGGALAATADGARLTHRLDRTHVFEDLTPRIVDLDGDGANEVVVIRSGLADGAALGVYGLRDGALVEIASTEPIGRPNRWLNVAGIADFTNDGGLDIAIVVTPHIGGRLEVWTMRGGRLIRVAAAEGFSNHAIGSTELGLSAVADIDGDGAADLALPDARRSALRMVSAKDGELADLDRVRLPAAIVTAIGVVEGDGGPVFVLGLADGRAVAIVR